MVKTVAAMGQPALGLTDHGNMAGSVQLYSASKKAGILPFPGSELYIVRDRTDTKAKRHHMCVVAYTTKGYENLVRLSTLSHTNFHHKPLIDHSDLADLSSQGLLDGIAATSGCFFSLTAQATDRGDFGEAKALLSTYAGWFPKFYVELQNHNIDHGNGNTDDDLAETLFGFANELGLPCVITQDAHYCHQHDKENHESLKRLVSFGPDADDAVFPGDGFHLAEAVWIEARHNVARLSAGLAGLADLLDSHRLSIPELDAYSYSIPITVVDPYKDLATRCTKELAKRDLSEKYTDRLLDELAVIRDTGMAGYLLLVAEVTDWCTTSEIFYQARGSASGSIICWLLGITQADPLKWKLRFERFISRDRTKPPDIDLDVEHDRRQDLIEWLSQRFAVHQIGTWSQYSLQGEDENTKGSLRIRYYSRLRATGAPVPEWKDVPAKDKEMLAKIANVGAYSAYGTHAAGLVVTTTESDFARLVPLMKVASSNTMVTQYEMADVEKLGLVKLDVLGLKTLSVLHRTMENLGRSVFDGLDWIPLTDKKTFQAVSKGKTEGVFQLEGYTAKYGCRQLKPTTVKDIIAAMALFRPATMNSGATSSYISRKHKEEEVPVRHSIIDQNTKNTYGIMLYQEQVIGILRDLGMDADNLTAFLKAVKASNADVGNAAQVIAGYRARVDEMCQEAGFTDADKDWLWKQIEGFSAYGFNQAHATAYGITAYRCAYLAENHPLEFHAALLAVAAGTDKEANYVKASRDRGLRVMKADINYSGVTYGVDPKKRGIRKGLLALKGIGEKAAIEIVEQRPESGYETLEHFCKSVSHRKITGVKAYIESGDSSVGTLGKLVDHGALSSILDEM